jgi:thiol-disulfide isomerase/thioredoxin
MKQKFFIVASIILTTIFACDSDEKIVVENETNDNIELKGVVVEKKILIEDYSATWCGNCILAVNKAENADKNYFVPVVIHAFGSDLQNTHSIKIAKENGISSQTVLIIDRKTNHNFKSDINYDTYKNITKSKLAIKLASTEANGIITADISLKFYEKYKDLKVNLYLLEDKIINKQANYHFSNLSNPVTNFEHNHVLKHASTNIKINQPDSLEKIFDYNIDIELDQIDKTNASIVAYVTSEGNIVNVQSAKVGETIDFHKIIEN